MKKFRQFITEAEGWTPQKIKSELAKLNYRQRKALRKEYSGRNITAFKFDEKIDKVSVEFDNKVWHHFFLGKNGAIKQRTMQ